MTKQEFVEQLARRTQLPKQKTREVVDSLLGLIVESLERREKVRLAGFGTFLPYELKASRRINPRTRQPIQTPARLVPKFRPSAAFKRTLSQR